ncbi:hypothetical protein [Pseudoalteromonas sp.]|uniref:hypothetical protein n=1 Tax=Pseudoalteromonas sp. TaxID=53249 RepID=UPI001BCE8B8C|nr:hypothetical protein [Pseudoalteromonas sp.]
MENNSTQKTIIQHSNYEFKPDFASALEREINKEASASNEPVKADLADSFGSWYEWD